MAAPVAAVAGFLVLRKIIKLIVKIVLFLVFAAGDLLRGHVRAGVADKPGIGSSVKPGDHHHGSGPVQRGSVTGPVGEDRGGIRPLPRTPGAARHRNRSEGTGGQLHGGPDRGDLVRPTTASRRATSCRSVAGRPGRT